MSALAATPSTATATSSSLTASTTTSSTGEQKSSSPSLTDEIRKDVEKRTDLLARKSALFDLIRRLSLPLLNQLNTSVSVHREYTVVTHSSDMNSGLRAILNTIRTLIAELPEVEARNFRREIRLLVSRLLPPKVDDDYVLI